MKAIDFACRFLSRLQRDELSPAARLVLVAVAAGLEDKTDISRETGLSHSVCTTQLRHLQFQGLLRCISPLSERTGGCRRGPVRKQREKAKRSDSYGA